MGATLAELPRRTPNYDSIATAAADATITVATGGDINAAITSAVSQLQSLGTGKIVDILLAASGSYGPATVTLQKHGVTNGWIRLKTNTTLPAVGTRILPSTGGSLATLTIADTASGIIPAAGAQGYMIDGLKMVCSATQDTHPFIDVRYNSGALSAVSDIASRLSFRHLWIAGNAALSTRRFGINISGANIEIVDSYLVHFNYNAVDYSNQSQSITMPSGTGPIRIENNVLWRSSEGIAFGGANQFPVYEPLQMIPSDITIRRNHIYMPLSYKGTAAPSEMCANGIEFKQGRRVLIENNIIENVWKDSQPGFGLVMWSANQYGANEPWVDTCDFTVRYNWFKNCSGNWENSTILDPVNEPSNYPRRVNVHDNLGTGYGNAVLASPADGSNTQQVWIVKAGANDIRYANNTAIGPGGTYVWVGDNVAYTRLEITNNVIGTTGTPSAILFTSSGTGQTGWNVINTNGDCIFSGNVCIDAGTNTTPNTGTNSAVTALADVGFADSTKCQDTTLTYAGLSALAISGTYAGKGCDITGLITNLSGVECPAADLPT